MGVRYFSGARDSRTSGGRMGVASELMKIEIMKKGKLPADFRYRHIFKKRLAESQGKAMQTRAEAAKKHGIKNLFGMSKRAENALKEIAQRKANKEAKALRQMVIVQPRIYPTGRLTAKGKIYDQEGTQVGEVNLKNGKMAAMNGWGIGKYKPKSIFTDIAIQDAINKYSPFFINQRKLQAMQQAGQQNFGVWGPQASGQETINLFGYNPSAAAPPASESFGFDTMGPRQNVGMTSWGARSDNVWGSYTDNVWGTSSDTVWGTNQGDVWGGIGAGRFWSKGPNIWGTGNGRNYIRAITNRIAGFFGFSNKENRNKLKALNERVRSQGGNNSRNAAARGSAPSRSR